MVQGMFLGMAWQAVDGNVWWGANQSNSNEKISIILEIGLGNVLGICWGGWFAEWFGLGIGSGNGLGIGSRNALKIDLWNAFGNGLENVSEQYNVATDLESDFKLVSESVSSNIIKPLELHKILIF